MRAVKSIILAAGNFKRNFPFEDEQVLILRAISDCNIPKFTSKDVPLFNAIISDLFPKLQVDERDYGYLAKAIEIISEEAHLNLTKVLFIFFNLIYILKKNLNKKFYTKVIELYETIQVRHGLMVVGKTLSGKTE